LNHTAYRATGARPFTMNHDRTLRRSRDDELSLSATDEEGTEKHNGEGAFAIVMPPSRHTVQKPELVCSQILGIGLKVCYVF